MSGKLHYSSACASGLSLSLCHRPRLVSDVMLVSVVVHVATGGHALLSLPFTFPTEVVVVGRKVHDVFHVLRQVLDQGLTFIVPDSCNVVSSALSRAKWSGCSGSSGTPPDYFLAIVLTTQTRYVKMRVLFISKQTISFSQRVQLFDSSIYSFHVFQYLIVHVWKWSFSPSFSHMFSRVFQFISSQFFLAQNPLYILDVSLGVWPFMAMTCTMLQDESIH